MAMETQTRFNLLYFLFAMVALLLLQQWWQASQTIEVLPYSEFEKLLLETPPLPFEPETILIPAGEFLMAAMVGTRLNALVHKGLNNPIV